MLERMRSTRVVENFGRNRERSLDERPFDVGPDNLQASLLGSPFGDGDVLGKLEGLGSEQFEIADI